MKVADGPPPALRATPASGGYGLPIAYCLLPIAHCPSLPIHMPSHLFHPSSFRDPSGFIFRHEGRYYRQVNRSYAADYDLLMNSGLYEALTAKQMLIPHRDVNQPVADPANAYKTLEPEQVPFITYPYEWCYGQFRDAALLTLNVQRTAMQHGMVIKDATPFNIQFHKGRPVFIDTLSFEKYDETKPWVAYRQFCNLFLFPLYLEYYLKTDIQKIMIAYPEGIPVDITSKLLPLKSSLSLGVWLHVYLQNTVTRNSRTNRDTEKFSRKKLLQLISHLEGTIQNLNGRAAKSEWSDYYETSIIGKDYLAAKEQIFREFLQHFTASTALDLGANDGYFSKIMLEAGMNVVAADSDSRSISKLYKNVKNNAYANLLPVVVDTANPTPAIGFRNRERASFHERVKTELVAALAVVHHLVIGRNISLRALANYLGEITERWLIVEWVPREDEKVQQMLASRKDVFGDYTLTIFEESFAEYFNIVKSEKAGTTPRIIYLMEKR